MKVLLLLLLVWQSHGQLYQPTEITNSEFLHYYTSGASLSYQVDVNKCRPETSVNNITLYSFNEKIQNGYVTVKQDGSWLLTSGVERRVDGKHLHLKGPALRYTGLSLDGTSVSIVGMNDINPLNYENLAQAQMYCQMDQGDNSGLRVFAESPPGTILETVSDVKKAVEEGYSLHYAIDFFQCEPAVSKTDQQWFAGRVDGTRYSQRGDLVFTVAIDDMLTEFVGNVILQDNNVQMKSYSYYKPEGTSSQASDKNCTFGPNGNVRIFKRQ